MKTGIRDLNEHLFRMLEDLDGTDKDGEEISQDALTARIGRANAVVSVASTIVQVKALELRAVDLYVEHGHRIGGMIDGFIDTRPKGDLRPLRVDNN